MLNDGGVVSSFNVRGGEDRVDASQFQRGQSRDISSLYFQNLGGVWLMGYMIEDESALLKVGKLCRRQPFKSNLVDFFKQRVRIHPLSSHQEIVNLFGRSGPL